MRTPHPPSVIARSAEGTTWQSLVCEYSTNENEGAPRERLLRGYKTAPRNDSTPRGGLSHSVIARSSHPPIRHCEERSDEAISGTKSYYLSLLPTLIDIHTSWCYTFYEKTTKGRSKIWGIKIVYGRK